MLPIMLAAFIAASATPGVDKAEPCINPATVARPARSGKRAVRRISSSASSAASSASAPRRIYRKPSKVVKYPCEPVDLETPILRVEEVPPLSFDRYLAVFAPYETTVPDFYVIPTLPELPTEFETSPPAPAFYPYGPSCCSLAVPPYVPSGPLAPIDEPPAWGLALLGIVAVSIGARRRR